MIKKIIVVFGVLSFVLSGFIFSNIAFAEEGSPETLLPGTSLSYEDCKKLFVENKRTNLEKVLDRKPAENEERAENLTINNILGCGIRTGNITLWMVPYYIRYILEFIIGIAGLAAVASIIYGGYLYLFAGLSEDKDKGKKAIIYGLAGMVMTLLAWAFVNIVIRLVTM